MRIPAATMSSSRAPVHILLMIALEPERINDLARAGFRPWKSNEASPSGSMVAADIRAVVTNGDIGLSAQQMDALPALELICAIGAGFENIDVAAAKIRGITVTHGRGTNDACVAEHALALLLSLGRDVVRSDRLVRAGSWSESREPRRSVIGKRLGIFGLGRIGTLLANRARSGLDMEIGYCNRRRNPDCRFRYFDRLADLAGWCDILVVTAPGGSETYHAVNEQTLEALGPDGFLVNVGRGTIVDSNALVTALRSNTIAGAALDVIEGEPSIPPNLLQTQNLIVTPHIAGRSPESRQRMMALMHRNLVSHFRGEKAPGILTF